MRMALLAALIPGSLGLAAPLTGQGALVDEGIFLLSLAGEPVGEEAFSIRRTGVGEDARIVAQGAIEIALRGGSLVLSPVLETRSDFSLTGYQNRVEGSRDETFTLTEAMDRRLRGRMLSPEGEAVREYRATPGTVLLEDWVAHQFHAVGARIDLGTTEIPVIVPGETRPLLLRADSLPPAPIRIGERDVAALGFEFRFGTRTRRVWFDALGRVLRVEDPASGYQAIRSVPPS